MRTVGIFTFVAGICAVSAITKYGECFKQPSYISSETILRTHSGSQSEAMIEHGFGDFPIKADVQITPLKGGVGQKVIFPGIGSAQRDDDDAIPYGGAVFSYDKTSVYVYVPNAHDGHKSGTIVYTGGSEWIGPAKYNESAASVRVKVWSAADFPSPDFESNWLPISSQNGSASFLEVKHHLGMAPDYVIVQVKHGNKEMVSEGIGSSMILNNMKNTTEFGGVIYAYNDSHVRLWAPGQMGYIFSLADGWGNGQTEKVKNGYVKVRAWRHFNARLTVNTNAEYSTRASNPRVVNLNVPVSFDTGLVDVRVKVISPVSWENNLIFPAMGAVQNDKHGEGFGGVVYSYTNTTVQIWHPDLTAPSSYIAYVSDNWAAGVHTVRAKHADLMVHVWDAFVKCPPKTTTLPQPSSTQSSTTSKPRATTSQNRVTSPAAININIPHTGQVRFSLSTGTSRQFSRATKFIKPTVKSTTKRRTTEFNSFNTHLQQQDKGSSGWISFDDGITVTTSGAIVVVTCLLVTGCLLGCVCGCILGTSKSKTKRVEPIQENA